VSECSKSTDDRASLLEAILDSMPPQIMAAGMVKACGLLTKERPDLAQRMLLNMWLQIVPTLLLAVNKEPRGKLASAVLFLESYFAHAGDWRRMEFELKDHAPADAALVGRVVQIISETMMKASEGIK